MNADSWPLWFQLTFQALVLQALPGFSRPGILFAVTVPDAFVSNAGRALLSRYRAVVWTGTAIALAIVLLVPTSGSGNEGILYLAVIGGNAIVGVGAWLWAHRRARAYAIPHSEKRVASLVTLLCPAARCSPSGLCCCC
jgi:hypothetical protein